LSTDPYRARRRVFSVVAKLGNSLEFHIPKIWCGRVRTRFAGSVPDSSMGGALCALSSPVARLQAGANIGDLHSIRVCRATLVARGKGSQMHHS
jgi:hypothetical protein